MTTIDATHDPALRSWVASAAEHRDFPIQNLPLGIFSPPGGAPGPGVAIGDAILDLGSVAAYLPDAVSHALAGTTLNALFALGTEARVALRRTLSRILSDRAFEQIAVLHRAADCTLHLPAAIGDYTDFYVGIHHATNVGRVFRPETPLLPNYKYVPIGYHGRASSVRPSPEPVVRPLGQLKLADAPEFGPSRRLDYELELGVWIGTGNALGAPIAIGEATDHVAGFTLLNDWSARDLQAWEYQPLGPFLAKSFHTTVSPWVVTPEALAPFRIAQPARPAGDPAPLAYLDDAADRAHGALALTLTAHLSTEAMREAGKRPHLLGRSAATEMYWTVAQIVTHHASNGCNLRPGDLLGTGTISGPDAGSLGSLFEITGNGADPLTLPNGEARAFLEDGDEVILTARAEAPGFVPIGFGEARARVLPARGQ